MSEKDMQELFELVERNLGAEWLDLIDWLREQNALDEIDRRLAEGDRAGVIQEVEAAAKRYSEAIKDGYVTAGEKTAVWLSGKLDNAVSFNADTTRATQWAKRNAAELVSGLTDEVKQTVRAVIADGVAAADNPRVIAGDIRASIGLTPDQARAVASYRRALESRDFANALGRELSDGRSDKTIAAARDKGRALTQAQSDTAVDRYRDNYVSYRAEVIARTEALRAVHSGNEELFQQAIDRGEVDADQLTRTWNTASDSRTRPSHRAMNGQQRDFGEPFESGDGASLRYPGDPSAPIEETAQCRCTVSTTIGSLKRRRLDPLPGAHIVSRSSAA